MKKKRYFNKLELIEEATRTNFEGEVDEKEVERLISSMIDKSSLCSGDAAMFVYDLRYDRFLYIESSIALITGMSTQEVLQKTTSEFAAAIITDEHMWPVSHLTKKAYEFFLKKVASPSLTLNIDFNIEDTQHNHKRLLAQFKPAIWNKLGQPLITQGKFTDITHLSKKGKPKLTVVTNNKKIYEEEGDIILFKKDISFNLTKTEFTVLSMINQGKSNEEIAESLDMKISTLYTHRKNMKEKTGKSPQQLIIQLSESGLI